MKRFLQGKIHFGKAVNVYMLVGMHSKRERCLKFLVSCPLYQHTHIHTHLIYEAV